VTLIVDAAPLVALADTADRMREPVRAALAAETGRLVIPAPVTAEVDYLLGVRHGPVARRSFLADLAAGRFAVECLEPADHQRVLELETRYADLDLGLADCSLVVLAARHRTDRLLSFDERHLRAVKPLHGEAFRLLPQDA
jgi:predicted nucleic acid-binding protein